MTYIVRTTINPTVDLEVDDAELEQLTELGLLVNAPANPVPGVFDTESANLINTASNTRAALDARYPLGTGVREVRLLTRAQYDAIGTKTGTTLYVIQG